MKRNPEKHLNDIFVSVLSQDRLSLSDVLGYSFVTPKVMELLASARSILLVIAFIDLVAPKGAVWFE